MFCWPCISIYACNKTNLTHHLPRIFSLFSHYISTRFGLASCPSSGGNYVCMQQCVRVVLLSLQPAGRRQSTKTRAVFTHGPKEPGPMAANFQGRHIKRIEIEVWYAGKKKLSTREKFKGDLYWKHYDLSFISFLCCFCLHITEFEQMGRGGKIFLGPGA
jgi:hypothetical protein